MGHASDEQIEKPYDKECHIVKKLISFLLIFTVLFSVTVMAGEEVTLPCEVMIGDLDFSGTVDAQDALYVLKIATLKLAYTTYWYGNNWPDGIPVYIPHHAIVDVDNSGKCNSADALMILQYAVGKRVEFVRTEVYVPEGYTFPTMR